MDSSSEKMTVDQLTELVREFAVAREWEQFHSPRNLVLALIGEVGELAAEFQWTDDADVPSVLVDESRRQAIQSEMADILNYLLRLADVVGVNLAQALIDKVEVNRQRYPADQARGSSAKYTQYE